MNRPTLFEEVVRSLRNDLHAAQAWQLVVIALALLGAWLYARHIEQRIRDRLAAAMSDKHGVRVDVLKFSIDG
ncbi:MAG TPA: hypothetical protein VJU53_14400, partial [Burkholderiaceae bacterium]|nr:hypothetical protein [Burkholderiaceae bacterium]